MRTPLNRSFASRSPWILVVFSLVAAFIFSLTAGAARSSNVGSAATGSIYWGAYMDGQDTYNYMYGCCWSDAPWDADTWGRFESNAKKKVSIVHWGIRPPWLATFNSYVGAFNLVRNAGEINAVSMSTGSVKLRDIAAGKYDSSIRTWAQQAASWGYPFFLLLDVEMNGTWAPYSPGVNGNTATDFINMWRHFHDVAVNAGAKNITWVWAPNVDPRSLFTPYSQVYPGSAYVDWTGLDGFNKDGTQTFSWLYGSSYNKLLQLAPTKPIMVTQTSSVEVKKAAWITEALVNQLPNYFPKIEALLWFNWRIYQNGKWWPWHIESSSTARSAFATAVSSSYYRAGGGFANLTRLTKVQPLP